MSNLYTKATSDTFTLAYLEAMWFTDTARPELVGIEGEISNEKGYDDIAESSLAKIVADCEAFKAKAASILEQVEEVGTGLTVEERAGHDFWLTRNGHGAGFWDGDWDSFGDDLTDIAHSFGEQNVYTGDDGKVYVSPEA